MKQNRSARNAKLKRNIAKLEEKSERHD